MHTVCSVGVSFSFFFFNDTATTEIYTLSLHDALPISLAEYVGELSVSHHAPHGYATHNLEDALAVARRVNVCVHVRLRLCVVRAPALFVRHLFGLAFLPSLPVTVTDCDTSRPRIRFYLIRR